LYSEKTQLYTGWGVRLAYFKPYSPDALFTGGKMKYYREITGSIIVSILLIAAISTCIVCGAVSEDTSDSDKAYYALASIMLDPKEDDKTTMMQWIDETELLSEDEKPELKQNLLDAWERFPDNTDEDLEAAKLALDIAVDVAAKEKAANPTSTASTSSSKTYNTQDETVGERPPVEEDEVEEVVEEMAVEEETTQSATPGFSALSLVFVISLILLRRNR
jgi:hypothetical protein